MDQWFAIAPVTVRSAHPLDFRGRRSREFDVRRSTSARGRQFFKKTAIKGIDLSATHRLVVISVRSSESFVFQCLCYDSRDSFFATCC